MRDAENQNSINQQNTFTNAAETEHSNIESSSSLIPPGYNITNGSPNEDTNNPSITNQNNASNSRHNNVNNNSFPSTESKTEESETGIWTPPFNLETVKTAKEAKDCLWRLINNAKKVSTTITESDGNIIGDLASLDYETKSISTLWGIFQDSYEDDEPIEKSDIEALQEAGIQFEQSYTVNANGVKSTTIQGLSKLGKFKKIDTSSDKLRAALQNAYDNEDSVLIDKFSSYLSTAELYNSKGEDVKSFINKNIYKIDDSPLLDLIDEKKTKVFDTANKVLDVFTVGNDLLNISNGINNTGKSLGGQAEKLGSLMELVDRGINIVELPGINIIQSLWNDCYKPMIDVCVEGLSKIEHGVIKNRRDALVIGLEKWNEKLIDKNNNAPSYVKDKLAFFEGGWDVFNFMWNAMCNQRDRLPNEAVITYFENNYDRISAGAGSGEKLPYKGIVPFWHLEPQDVMTWSITNKYNLWGMFYGSYFPYPPKTK